MEARCWCWWSIVALLVAAHCCIACLPHERDSLLLIKKDINPRPSRLQNWKGDDCCSWDYVTCNSSTYRVQELYLDGVRGEESGKWYPNATLFAQFKQLSELVLSYNQIAGWRMPQDLCGLNNLHHLNLGHNKLEDQAMPQCLGKLLKMETLDLSYNKLSGHFFSSSGLCELSNLHGLSLSSNNLDDQSLPQCLGKLLKMEFLDLSYNNLRGHSFSSSGLCELSNLHGLSLSSNNLDDQSLPQCLGKLLKMEFLDLSYNNLRGHFFSSSDLCGLNNLHHLILGGNKLEDQAMPQCSGKLLKMETLDLSYNNLSGHFFSSSGLCELSNLRELSLRSNNLDDQSLPKCLGKLLKMEFLDLSYNNLRDHFFSSSGLCELRKLKSMNLGYNSIEGRIPPCIGYMQSLEELDLSGNLISGSIRPLGNLSLLGWILLSDTNLDGVFEFSTFANLSMLKRVDLSNNPMLEVETESSTWVSSFQLYRLDLSNTQVNKRSGNVIPSFLATQNSLRVLDLSNTHLTGNIPNWLFYNLTVAYELLLSNNQLGGSFPLPSQGISTNGITGLDISNNLFRGIFPTNISNFFPSLRYLNMSGNSLQGEISLSSNMASLETLDLSSNNFSGEIHMLLANSPSLVQLRLSNNKLHGDIPFPNSNLSALRFLFIDGNGFTKTVSRMPSNSTNLQALNFRRNFFKGIIPTWLPTLGNLSFALLSHNDFHGPIPTELCQMQNLRFLDLSNNHLSGTIPSCLHDISAWMKKTLVDLRLFSPPAPQFTSFRTEFTTKGNLWSYEGTPLSMMTGIDFSLNQLTGNIPKELGYLSELHSLNLSYNNLMGYIPESFQYLDNIESLDLSHNRLIGRIPPQLTALTTLGTFNVAFNNLSGALPDWERQFSTFNASSYEGNPGLCGKPLERNCSSNNPSHPPHPAIEEEDDTLRFVDNPVFFYSFVAASYALGFWGFIILLALNGTWRKKFFLTSDRFFEFCGEIIKG